jgi:hypothetical protein
MSQPPAGSSARKPAVLFVYSTYTQQTLKVAEEMAGVLRRRRCDVHLAAIEFTDPRYAGRFSQFPMRHPFLEVLGMIPAELRRRPAEIQIRRRDQILPGRKPRPSGAADACAAER